MPDVLDKLETALIQVFSEENACCAVGAVLTQTEYDKIYNPYDAACEKVENGSTEGTDIDDNIIDITGYPVRQLPPIKKGFDE